MFSNKKTSRPKIQLYDLLSDEEEKVWDNFMVQQFFESYDPKDAIYDNYEKELRLRLRNKY